MGNRLQQGDSDSTTRQFRRTCVRMSEGGRRRRRGAGSRSTTILRILCPRSLRHLRKPRRMFRLISIKGTGITWEPQSLVVRARTPHICNLRSVRAYIRAYMHSCFHVRCDRIELYQKIKGSRKFSFFYEIYRVSPLWCSRKKP